MPLFDYTCKRCKISFETITSLRESAQVKCNKCNKNDKIEKRVPLFRVGGRGDLRESTLHGCHDCEVSPGTEDHSGHGHSKKTGTHD